MWSGKICGVVDNHATLTAIWQSTMPKENLIKIEISLSLSLLITIYVIWCGFERPYLQNLKFFFRRHESLLRHESAKSQASSSSTFIWNINSAAIKLLFYGTGNKLSNRKRFRINSAKLETIFFEICQNKLHRVRYRYTI